MCVTQRVFCKTAQGWTAPPPSQGVDLKMLQPLQNMAHISSLAPSEQLAFWSSLAGREFLEKNNNDSNKSNDNNNNTSIDSSSSAKKLGKPGRKPVRDPNKPFQCPECEYSSKSKSNFTIHMRIHTGEKPFACTQCNYRTSQKGNLRIHQERRHSIHREQRNSVPADFAFNATLPQLDKTPPASSPEEPQPTTFRDIQSMQASMATIAYLGTALGALGTSLAAPGTFASKVAGLTSAVAPRTLVDPDDEISNPDSPPSL